MSLPKHMPALDGLRGVAILMVILFHTSMGWIQAMIIYEDPSNRLPTFTLPHWLQSITWSAQHGVQLFFVVSAFTLTSRMTRRASDIPAYALRRIARVGPGYWVAAFGYTMLAGMGARSMAPQGLTPNDIIIAVLFGSVWQGGASLSVVPGGWSVASEVCFYFLLPLFIWIINERVWRAILLAIAAALAAQVWARHAMLAGAWNGNFAAYCNPIAQIPVFLFGVAAATVVARVSPPPAPWVVTIFLGLAIAVLPLQPPFWPGPWFVIPHLVFAVLASIAVMFAAIHPPGFLTWRWIRRVGEVSYSMYLVHFILVAPCLWLAQRLVPFDDWSTFGLHFSLTASSTFCVSTLTYRLIERPAIDWAARLTRPPDPNVNACSRRRQQ